ncbi:Imm10 family immunity protein [Planosporangium sp. 12N6]|uniref:Imm10 family immunity protein n=1 Tax=Planosporangium spinosum TaxID=3402278 RepID=UPI003CF309A5
MTMRFTARVAGVDDSDCLVAGVAEHEDSTGRSLIFQAAQEPPDDQEIRLGMDTYCLVTESQGTAYGCVEEIVIDRDQLRIVLRKDALADLDLNDDVVEVELAADPEATQTFRDMLREILAYGRDNARPTVVRL